MKKKRRRTKTPPFKKGRYKTSTAFENTYCKHTILRLLHVIYNNKKAFICWRIKHRSVLKSDELAEIELIYERLFLRYQDNDTVGILFVFSS